MRARPATFTKLDRLDETFSFSLHRTRGPCLAQLHISKPIRSHTHTHTPFPVGSEVFANLYDGRYRAIHRVAGDRRHGSVNALNIYGGPLYNHRGAEPKFSSVVLRKWRYGRKNVAYTRVWKDEYFTNGRC